MFLAVFVFVTDAMNMKDTCTGPKPPWQTNLGREKPKSLKQSSTRSSRRSSPESWSRRSHTPNVLNKIPGWIEFNVYFISGFC